MRDMSDDRSAAALSLTAQVEIRRKAFVVDSREEHVLDHLAFDVRQSEVVGILGPSGCGKTTLLRLIAGLDTDYEGSILVAGTAITGPSRDRSLLFQESRLLPWMRAAQNISFALPPTLAKRERDAIVTRALNQVGLSEHGRAWPSQLSGGMKKRVALARAIVNDPLMLLLDEPFAALDGPTKYALQDQLAHIGVARTNQTTVLVTHDVAEAVYLSDRILILASRPSRILREIAVTLDRPRRRDTGDFQDTCASVTRAVFQVWWDTKQGGRSSDD